MTSHEAKWRWVPAWSASPQPVWTGGLPLEAEVPADLQDVTVRQIIRLGYAGRRIRLVLSNRYGTNSLRLDALSVAPSLGGVDIDPVRSLPLLFGGAEQVTLLPGATVASDPVAMSVSQGDDLALSIRLTKAPRIGSFHWDGRRTAYILPGDGLTAASPMIRATTERRLFVAGALVEGPDPRGVVVAFGDSITDGASATLDRESRWPDFLAAKGATSGYAVVNAGISGARLLSDGMGLSAGARFDADVLSQPGVSAVILLLGINDIAWPQTVFAPQEPPMTFERMVAGYRLFIARGHAANLRVIGGTLIPFAGALPDTPMAPNFHTREKDALRRRVNDWMRTAGGFDAIIDFDRLLEDPENPGYLLPRYDGGDHLHPGDDGNQAMTEAIDLQAMCGV